LIRVLLADDQALVRHGFGMILGAAEGVDVAGEAGDGAEAVSLAAELSPDVVLMDVRMPELDGIEATRRIVSGVDSPRVLVLTTFDNDEIVMGALRAGASGFLLKDAPGDQLVAAIKVVAGGGSLFAPSVTRRLVERYVDQGRPDADVPGLDELTEREREILLLVARGLSNAEIAGKLVLSEHTVKTHITHLLQKLGLRDRTQIVVLAYEAGIVRRGER
jgi:DNA-binding NarL/FixJ family response regulator